MMGSEGARFAAAAAAAAAAEVCPVSSSPLPPPASIPLSLPLFEPIFPSISHYLPSSAESATLIRTELRISVSFDGFTAASACVSS